VRLIYVAHKIRDSRGPWYMEENIRQGEAIALELWRMGNCGVICPGKNTQGFDGAAPDDVWLNGDLEIVRRCDAVVMTPNSATSVGAQGEKREALDHHIQVFEWPADKERIRGFLGVKSS
jgi:hypothetical protein